MPFKICLLHIDYYCCPYYILAKLPLGILKNYLVLIPEAVQTE